MGPYDTVVRAGPDLRMRAADTSRAELEWALGSICSSKLSQSACGPQHSVRLMHAAKNAKNRRYLVLISAAAQPQPVIHLGLTLLD